MKRAKSRNDNKVKYGTISLPLPLIKKIKEKIKSTGINSVSSYVAFTLRQILSSSKNEKPEEDIKQRLKRLGYL